MNNNPYLIPANSKKSQLILSFFRPIDLIIFVIGVSVSIILLIVFKTNSLGVMIGLASPALIAAFLVAPVPYYHNVMTLIGNVWRFLTGQKKYYWRGWCASYGNNESKYSERSTYK